MSISSLNFYPHKIVKLLSHMAIGTWTTQLCADVLVAGTKWYIILFKSGNNYTSIRAAKMKNSDNTKCWQECKASLSLIHSWREWNIVQPPWKVVWQFLKKIERTGSIWLSQSHSWVFISEKWKCISTLRPIYTCSQ